MQARTRFVDPPAMNRPRILDPRGVPVVGLDDHLPPIDPTRLREQALRQRLAAGPAWTPEFLGDGGRFNDQPPRDAAVLVGLVRGDAGLRVLLTQRTAHLNHHGGQVSFPGGRCEDSDADATATALREAQEEVGLNPRLVDVLGVLPSYSTVTGFVVTPVVAIVDAPDRYVPDPREVDAVFEVPLTFLMDPSNHRRHRFEWDGQSRDFLSMPWSDPQAGGVERFIWGATAAMLRNFYRCLLA